VATPAVRRQVEGFLGESFGMSERRACQAIGINQSTMFYETRQEDPTDLRARLRELAAATLLGRVAQPQDVARDIVLAADFVTGHVFVSDGGNAVGTITAGLTRTEPCAA